MIRIVTPGENELPNIEKAINAIIGKTLGRDENEQHIKLGINNSVYEAQDAIMLEPGVDYITCICPSGNDDEIFSILSRLNNFVEAASSIYSEGLPVGYEFIFFADTSMNINIFEAMSLGIIGREDEIADLMKQLIGTPEFLVPVEVRTLHAYDIAIALDKLFVAEGFEKTPGEKSIVRVAIEEASTTIIVNSPNITSDNNSNLAHQLSVLLYDSRGVMGFHTQNRGDNTAAVEFTGAQAIEGLHQKITEGGKAFAEDFKRAIANSKGPDLPGH